LVELVDLYPTLVDLVGLPASQEFQGVSLVKTLDEPDFEVRGMAFSASQNSAFLLRTEKWAYIQYGESGVGGVELFDMVNDPKQFINMAERPEYASVVAEFSRELEERLGALRRNDLDIRYE
jgi:arylsulfatase A-like enzyme